MRRRRTRRKRRKRKIIKLQEEKKLWYLRGRKITKEHRERK